MATCDNNNTDKVPFVIKFAFSEFKVDGDKWSAKCNKCNTSLTETKTVTSGFTK